MRRPMLFFALAACLAAGPGLAEEKKDDKGKAAPDFDALFGAPPEKNSSKLDAMKKATEGVGQKSGGSDLAPKAGSVEGDTGVVLTQVFAAEKIAQDKKLGCQPGGRDKKKIMEWTFDEVPARGVPFEVCLTLASKIGREMSMSVSIVDARNQRVAKAEDVIDFRGRTKIDHVLEYPAPTFKLAGPHFYVVDLDGKEAGRLQLFVVKLDAATTGVPGNAPEGKPAAPVTARPAEDASKNVLDKEPDGT
jgi:hypothetical protein